MFSIIITVIYITCIVCTISTESTVLTETVTDTTRVSTSYSASRTTSTSTEESTVLTETSSDEMTDTTRVSTSYSESRTASTTTQDVTSNTNTSQWPINSTQTILPTSTITGTDEQANTSLTISTISSMPSHDTTIGVTDTTLNPTTIGQMTLEEKQKRNGITSAVICVGSLILIWIAYLSSFIDKPSEKVPKIDHAKQPNSKYIYDSESQIVRDPNIKEGKKISFGEVSQFSKKQSPDTTNDIQMANIKETVTDDHSEHGKGTNTTRKSGWDVLTENPKFFDDYQPIRTNTNENSVNL